MSTTPRPRKDLWAFDRADRWGLGLLLGLVAAVTTAVAVVAPLVRWAGGDGLPLRYVGPLAVPALDRAGVAYDELGAVDATLANPSTAQRLLDLAPGVLATVLVVVGCWLVLGVLRDVGSGDPFRWRNVVRLRALALLVAVGAPVVWFARSSVDLSLVTSLDLEEGVAGALFELPWLPVVTGMVIALVAEAFRAGSRLREDVEGLV
ncbi:DUF2975 domain-containing protein [Phycicoccus sonneratiae]|uniref:DUF2975 domain-containing protein n=1 Tax=Phycicoccus sonneratiae TaxID=2807628 RepID=A0ABS2CPP3_9MICO|nr:DUF2975 domain-containing protein [Phycicoccus sonneraticus]MBM6401862.1 DUF2975 domain-containing protein [Phycicoccus sonneraticus]